MPKKLSQYEELGVDPVKESVRRIFGGCVDNDYPGAFVNIVYDPENPGQVFTQHMDGDVSKFVQRLLVCLETGNIEVVRGAVDDALQMNLGDIAASGFVFGKIVVTDVININQANVPKDKIIEQIALRFKELINLYRTYGFRIYFLGGETADLPDQVKSVAFDVAVSARAKKSEIISGNVSPGDKIYGFASDGRANWENEENSGIMSNGLTLARISTMWKGYTCKYPYLIRKGGAYNGYYKVGDRADLGGMDGSIVVSQALISPTRQWAILIRLLLEELKNRGIYHMLHGISLNTGGGATKIGHVGSGILYRKRMPYPPPIFQLIQRETRELWRNMYQTFNCGIGIDIVGENDPAFETALCRVSQETGVRLHKIGSCKQHKGQGNRVVLKTPFGLFDDY